MSAALFAARLASPGAGVREVASAVQAAPPAASPPTAADLLLDGWAALFADGLRRRDADTARSADPSSRTPRPPLTSSTCSGWPRSPRPWCGMTRAGTRCRSFHVELARSSGALSELPLALNSRTYIHPLPGRAGYGRRTDRGGTDAPPRRLEQASRRGAPLLSRPSAGVRATPRMLDADALEVAAADATRRGEGIGLTVIAWARALLYNTLGIPDQAFAAAQGAVDCPTNSAAAAWGLVELVEAAARVGATGDGFRGRPAVRGDRGRGRDRLGARSRREVTRALEHGGDRRAAVPRGARPPRAMPDARRPRARTPALRRVAAPRASPGRRARPAPRRPGPLHVDGDGRRSPSAHARELLATGETVRKRTVETRDDLTAQERHIARLARDGLSNPEIGARLFLSPRTVEWHLHKVFGKLAIRSRHELSTRVAELRARARPGLISAGSRHTALLHVAVGGHGGLLGGAPLPACVEVGRVPVPPVVGRGGLLEARRGAWPSRAAGRPACSTSVVVTRARAAG